MIHTLADISILITDGKHGDCQNEDNSGYYFISCKDVKDGWIDYTNARQITKADYIDTNKRTRLEPYDIVITNSGTIGRMALIPDEDETYRTTFQKSVAIIKPNKNKVIPQWLYYYLKANRESIVNWAGGTAQKNLLLRDMRAFTVEVPSIFIQKRIAFVLSNYDNLLENYKCCKKIIEEMAKLIYREWFVHYRFPGHENVRMVDSGTEFGEIPESMEVVKLDDICDLIKNKFEDSHSNLPLLDLAKMPQNSLLVRDSGNANELKTSRIIFEEDDMLFGSIRPYLRKVNLAPFKGVTNTSVLVLRSKDRKMSPYLTTLLSSERVLQWADQYSVGTKMPVIRWRDFKEMPILKPGKVLIEEFGVINQTIFELLKLTYFRNKNLIKTRDLILTKLISGELDVSELNIQET
ncbi:MAG: restriction endonuclease subunit S [Candidatus Hodarchaeales archaeon]